MDNEKLEQRVKKLVKTPSSVSYPRKIVYTVSRDDVVQLNAAIEPKIKQNQQERIASYLEMKDEIVRGK